MKGSWTYPDLIDLEYFLAGDRERPQADLHRRDRQLYLDFPAEIQQADKESLIQQWLLGLRHQEFPTGKSPGQTIVDLFKAFTIILLLCGAFLGLASGLTFFTYSGTTPVNVINFLFLFLFSQLLMLLFLFLGAGFRLAGLALLPAPITGFYGRTVAWLLQRSKKLDRILAASHRGEAAQLEGLLKTQRAVYGPTFYWPLFSLSQRVMVCFNLGLLTATLFRILTSDIAFGWQSTIQFSTAFISRTVQTLALPWSWIVPINHSFPSAAQIEGSRIILKDGIYHLQTQDLVSWWPFLVLCILFYGVLVRLLLVAAGRIGQWRALHSLKTDRPVLAQVVGRMTTPLMRSQAAAADAGSTHIADPEERGRSADSWRPVPPTTSLLVLLSEELSENYTGTGWKQFLSDIGFSVSGIEIYRQDAAAPHSLFEGVAGNVHLGEGGVMLVMESWMPPIKENLKLISYLRSSLGERVPVYVGLVGQRSTRGVIGPPTPVERKIWQQKLDGLADPYLSLVDIGSEDNDAT
jgi:hypothetical protein